MGPVGAARGLPGAAPASSLWAALHQASRECHPARSLLKLPTGQGKFAGVAAAEARPEGESITGARDFVSPAASATYRIEIPADGAYLLSAVCWWPQRAGGFTILVDEANMRDLTLRPSKGGPLGSWTLEKLAVPLFLGAGSHTMRIVGRTPGARIRRFELAPEPAPSAFGSRCMSSAWSPMAQVRLKR